MRRQGSPRSIEGPIEALFDPRSITVVGASDDPAKWGHILSRRAVESAAGRRVRLVNRVGGDVLGRESHRTLRQASEDLGESLDLVVVCVPVSGLLSTLTDALEAGARSLVVITAGLSETGEPGTRLEREMVRLVRAAGAVLIGPNCLGLVDTGAGLQLAHDVLPSGSVAVLSQSGNVVLDLAGLLAERGLGVSRFVSLGNQADLGVVELMASCLEHDRTRAVAVYAEDVLDGRAFLSTAQELRAAGKPVVLLAPGRSAAAVRSAESHTGSMTTISQVVDAACETAGIHRVDHPTEMADLLEGLLAGRRMRGGRVAILTDGGGHGAIAADVSAGVGLETPMLGERTRTALRDVLGPGSTVTNPVDLAGAGDRDPMTYTRTLQTLLVDDEVDGVLMTGYFGAYSTQTTVAGDREVAAARVMADLVQAQDKPVAVQTIEPTGGTAALLRSAGISVHRDIDRACVVLAGLIERPDSERLPPVRQDRWTASAPVSDASYAGARQLFTEAGVPISVARTVHDAEELDAALRAPEMTFPVVLKALGRVHKSEGGGVVLGLATTAAARTAYDAMVTALAPVAVSVETMVDTSHGVEVIVGCVRDRRFGPVLMVGLGGMFAEVLQDTAVAIAPVTPGEARRLLLSLRAAPLLLGARGRAGVDVSELAEVVARVSLVAAEHPELAELEVNPVFAGPAGVIALDARLVLDTRVPADPGT